MTILTSLAHSGIHAHTHGETTFLAVVSLFAASFFISYGVGFVITALTRSGR